MTANEELLDLATRVMKRAQALGADEVSVAVSRGTHVMLQRRDRKIEQATEASTRGLVLAVLANDRFSSNSTNDLRPDALDAFVRRSVESASVLEPDPFRRLPEGALCGRGVSDETLDQDDPSWARWTAADREAQALEIEEMLLAAAPSSRISASASVADERGEGVRVMSNGFADGTAGAWFSFGADLTLGDGVRRPEGGAYYAARHRTDLPALEVLVNDCVRSATERVGSKPIPSGTYPMVLENCDAGQVLGMLLGPMSGGALYEGRSCLQGKLGQPIACEALTIRDDPTIPRGLGSRPWDGDGFAARPRTVIEKGVLLTYYISQYHARKLGVEPTTGGKSNWLVEIPKNARPFREMVRDLPRAVQVTGFLGGQSNSTTGDFSFGIRGLLLERGEVVQSLSEMNVSGNLLQLMPRIAELGNDPWMFSSIRSPSLVIDGVQFSGT
jgi:PmbA protein